VNLNTNFLYPEEMRSASMVSLKSMLQVAAILFPAIIVMLIFYAHVKLEEKLSALTLEEARWAKVEVQKSRAETMNRDLRALRSSAEELEGWRRTRLEWNDLLNGLRGHVPASIQLKMLNARHSLELDAKGNLQRLINLTLTGRCAGPDADTKVQDFRRLISEQAPFSMIASNVVVSGLVEDLEPGAKEGDRVFEIGVEFNPRYFRETAGR
jgi:hypothetical protein